MLPRKGAGDHAFAGEQAEGVPGEDVLARHALGIGADAFGDQVLDTVEQALFRLVQAGQRMGRGGQQHGCRQRWAGRMQGPELTAPA